MAALTSFALAGLALASVTAGTVQGVAQHRQQRNALRSQQDAQRKAETMAQRQMRENAQALARANRKQPDLGYLWAGW